MPGPSGQQHAQRPFRLVGGGFVHDLLERLGFVRSLRRSWPFLFAFLLCWLPLLILSALEGHLFDRSIRVPFARDFVEHVRLLFSLPVLLLVEPFVDSRLRRVVEDFRALGLVRPEERPHFERAVTETVRAHEGRLAEILLLVIVWGATLGGNPEFAPLETTSWRTVTDEAGLHRSWASAWYLGVSLPVYRFVMLRWLFWSFMWARLLWRLARLRLQLQPTHPDRVGGLGFVNLGQVAFAVVVFPLSATFTTQVAAQMLVHERTLQQVAPTLAFFVGLAVLFFLAPLLAFSPQLVFARRRGLLAFGAFATTYTRAFDERWISPATAQESPLGSSDIQSLADLAHSFEVVDTMRALLPNRRLLLTLAVAALLPMGPLLLQQVPATVLLKRVIGLLV